jgi:hypothetical protein
VLFASRYLLAQDETVSLIQQPPAAAKKLLAQGSISGHVVFADTHTPARGARIMVMPIGATGDAGVAETTVRQPYMAIAALDGSFRVPHLPPGEYVVITFAAGYLSPLDGVLVPTLTDPKASDALLREKAPLVRVNGQEAARVEVELQRGAILAGKVVYSDGAPAAQLRILLQNVETKREGKPDDLVDAGAMLSGMILNRNPRTDDQGHFRISGIPGGRYRLAVIQTFETNLGEEMFADLNPGIPKSDKLAVYSGNTFHQKAAKVYEIRPGDTVDGIEVVLPLNGLHSVRGVATGKDGTPLNFGVVSLSDTGDPNINFHANIREDGEFRFSGIPEGIYEIKITGGLIVDNPTDSKFSEEQLPAMQDQIKPIRAFSETKVTVDVQATDIDDLAVMLADAELPRRTAPATDPDTSTDVVLGSPQ